MRLVVVVATAGRKELLGAFLMSLARQTRLPDEVILSAPNEDHIALPQELPFPVSCVFGALGSSAQRNLGLATALPKADIVTFFDDDYFPVRTYLAELELAFAHNASWAVVMGSAPFDGANSAGYTPAEAFQLLDTLDSTPADRPRQVEHAVGAYGCNMSVRAALVGGLRFDERLALYGWQEDIDFTSQLRASGPIIELGCLRGVHLGYKKGRVSGVKFGYAQMVNPAYLIRKGTMPVHFAFNLMIKNLAANVMRSIFPEPWIDRRGRLKGNIVGLYHIATGRIHPEQVAHL
ncbi:MAG: glycosyltransferase family 2 protein [Hyphomicrobium sp.]|nr:glycosyltransferase family 2 protein [Hyphomicrobium sp.]